MLPVFRWMTLISRLFYCFTVIFKISVFVFYIVSRDNTSESLRSFLLRRSLFPGFIMKNCVFFALCKLVLYVNIAFSSICFQSAIPKSLCFFTIPVGALLVLFMAPTVSWGIGDVIIKLYWIFQLCLAGFVFKHQNFTLNFSLGHYYDLLIRQIASIIATKDFGIVYLPRIFF